MERGSMIPWSVVAFVTLLVLAALLLSACATQGEYWRKVREPRPVRGVVYVAMPCGKSTWNGCANYASGYIELRRGMRPVLRECVEHHERKHFAGYEHLDIRHGFATDCGDGEMVAAGM